MTEKNLTPEKFPGHREGKKGIRLGIASVVCSPIPVAGLVLGKLAMDAGGRCRKLAPQPRRSFGLTGVLLGGLGFFIGLLVLAACVTVFFLGATNLLEIGA